MGMFDEVYIDKALLPLSEAEKAKIPVGYPWQTKSLDCLMQDVKIEKDKGLLVERYDFESVPANERPCPDPSDPLHFLGSIRKTNIKEEKIDYHGWVYFYGDPEGTWYEFGAKFTDGKLVEVVCIEIP